MADLGCLALWTQKLRGPVLVAFTEFREERQANVVTALAYKSGDKGC